MHMEFYLKSESDTRALAAKLARILKSGDILALSGPLGAGKSSLARGIIQTLAGADIAVPSPTYTLVQIYDHLTPPMWHFDLYRLSRVEEVWDIGIEEAFADGMSLIEWPERLGATLPASALWCELQPHDQGRMLTLRNEHPGYTDMWTERLRALQP